MQEKYEAEHQQLQKAKKELSDVQEDESIASLKVQLHELLVSNSCMVNNNTLNLSYSANRRLIFCFL